ncbi:hypothetical protein GGI11_000794 [Coemansia sp. RSA 2049]|nr:hypothetical protein H4217_008130 [Coemansia sp. RSA 1939]KAJ2524468.1 hypothetical protein GGI11_000794 [Coemansia sp. RSA 2049]KAJ2594756.1 hypothetical protein EV177_008289 [Coemansia sp. RSA 1804]KAJ2683409.1 hypothetical protein GGH99_004372 [Coemansia sp. RSA 1285]
MAARKGAQRLSLTMFTHNQCQLCVHAKEALEKVRQQVPFDVKEVDIRSPGNEAWFDEYKHDVPVIHVNNEFLLWHRVDVADTVAKLQKIRGSDSTEQPDTASGDAGK